MVGGPRGANDGDGELERESTLLMGAQASPSPSAVDDISFGVAWKYGSIEEWKIMYYPQGMQPEESLQRRQPP
jgi:hypothetical protein